MFGWLTRNDGRRGERAVRRLSSPRGAVFSEFALIMPIVLLVCSALIEIMGYWDAQVVANHAAWTTGRIAMVRGSDGLPFWGALDKKSKTGVTSTNMPTSIQKFLEDLTKGLQAANKFNNRGNIATLFLMSTCGIGYYGGTPKTDLKDAFNTIIDDGVSALLEGIPEMITEAITDFELPDFLPVEGDWVDAIKKWINDKIKKLLEELFRPLVEQIAKWLKILLEQLAEILHDLIDGDRFARQLYGGASRIVRAHDTTGKDALVVKDMESKFSNPFYFSKLTDHRLVYPQVADSEVKSDGYLVTGAHGWPPEAEEFMMTHVEVNWPYEYGWLFPVVSGGSGTSNGPVATGHSMVFPQPNIMNDNLYSEGAKAFDPGPATNNPFGSLDELQKEMKNYLKTVRFSMRYRLCEESLTMGDADPNKWHSNTLKFCEELTEAFNIDTNDLRKKPKTPVGGDYAECWKRFTKPSKQTELGRNLEKYFQTNNYWFRDYFYWEGATHARYGRSLSENHGDSGLSTWYTRRDTKALRYKGRAAGNAWGNVSQAQFNAVFGECLQVRDGWMTKDDRKFIQEKGKEVLYSNCLEFAKSAKVNVPNIVQWQGKVVRDWELTDKNVHDAAMKADVAFDTIQKLLRNEIQDIDDILAGTSSYTGSGDDPVFDPNDADAMRDPEAAAARAREKWRQLKEQLRLKLRQVDRAADSLRSQWAAYKKAVDDFEEKRAKCIHPYFTKAFIRTAARTRKANPSSSDYAFSSGALEYDIVGKTEEMLDIVTAYEKAVQKAYKEEYEYGSMLGLKSAERAKQEGKDPWEIVDEGGKPHSDTPGTLSPGSDTGMIIDKDHQTYKNGGWEWDN